MWGEAGPSPFLVCKEKVVMRLCTFRDVLCEVLTFPSAFPCINETTNSVQGELCISRRGPSVCLAFKQYALHGLIQLRISHWEVLATSHLSEAPVLQMNRPRFVVGTMHLLSLTLSSWYRQRCSLKQRQIHAGGPWSKAQELIPS